MRSLLVLSFVVGLLVSPSLAVVKVVISADGATFDGMNNRAIAAPGETITIKVYGSAATTGIASICGYVAADAGSPSGFLTTIPGSWTWGPEWGGYRHIDPANPVDENGDPVYDLNFANYVLGVKNDGLSTPATFSGPNGGYGTSTKFMGSVRLDPNRNPLNVGIDPNMVLIASYQVKMSAFAAPSGPMLLNWKDKGASAPLGYRTDSSTDGQTTDFSQGLMFLVPEPASMALLALSGLLVAHRRQA